MESFPRKLQIVIRTISKMSTKMQKKNIIIFEVLNTAFVSVENTLVACFELKEVNRHVEKWSFLKIF